MSWTYNLHGRPDTTLGMLSKEEDEDPGHMIIAERRDEHGVCDGYVLRDRDDQTRTANFDWVASGTPEQIMPVLVQRAIKDVDVR